MGFEEGCREKGIAITATYDIQGDADEGKRIIENIKKSQIRPKLVLAVGVLAAVLAKDQFADIPVIFCMVINYKRFDLAGANITGISSEVPVEDQFAILKEFLGANKSVGVIYDPKETGGIVAEAVTIGKKFNFNLINAVVVSEGKVESALKSIVKKIDALWIIPDSTVVTKKSLETILKFCLRHRLPVFCTSSVVVKAGALLSISPDYIQTGRQAAHLAQILLSNPAVLSLGVKQPDKLKITVNTHTAEIIGVDISPLRSRQGVVLYP